MLLAPTPSGIGAAFSFGRVFPVEAEMYSTVQLWFISVISGELQRSLTRPNVEVKFFKCDFGNNLLLKGRGKFWQFVVGSGLLWLGVGGGLGLGNCLVYDFR